MCKTIGSSSYDDQFTNKIILIYKLKQYFPLLAGFCLFAALLRDLHDDIIRGFGQIVSW